MDEFEFDRLIGLHQKGLLTGEKKRLVEDWLDSSDESGETYFNKADEGRLKDTILRQIKGASATMEGTQPDADRGARSWTIYKVAASIALLLIAGYLLWYAVAVRSAYTMLTATSSGKIIKVILADGTLVWLKGYSTLTYPATLSGDTRAVSLQGEALFEVARDARHPFVIHCGELTTTVLGTSFNIRSGMAKIEVTVLTGKVSLASAHDTKGVIVLPNEKVIYDGWQRPVSKAAIAAEEKSDITGGTEYTMVFNDTRMSEVIRRIERKFGCKLMMADAQLGHCRVTADFSDQSLERTISMIAQALGITYEINDCTVTLQGKGCN